MKGLTVTKIVKEIKFEGVWDKLEVKNFSQRQPFRNYLRQTPVFMWNNALGERFDFYFSGVFG